METHTPQEIWVNALQQPGLITASITTIDVQIIPLSIMAQTYQIKPYPCGLAPCVEARVNELLSNERPGANVTAVRVQRCNELLCQLGVATVADKGRLHCNKPGCKEAVLPAGFFPVHFTANPIAVDGTVRATTCWPSSQALWPVDCGYRYNELMFYFLAGAAGGDPNTSPQLFSALTHTPVIVTDNSDTTANYYAKLTTAMLRAYQVNCGANDYTIVHTSLPEFFVTEDATITKEQYEQDCIDFLKYQGIGLEAPANPIVVVDTQSAATARAFESLIITYEIKVKDKAVVRMPIPRTSKSLCMNDAYLKLRPPSWYTNPATSGYTADTAMPAKIQVTIPGCLGDMCVKCARLKMTQMLLVLHWVYDETDDSVTIEHVTCDTDTSFILDAAPACVQHAYMVAHKPAPTNTAMAEDTMTTTVCVPECKKTREQLCAACHDVATMEKTVATWRAQCDKTHPTAARVLRDKLTAAITAADPIVKHHLRVYRRLYVSSDNRLLSAIAVAELATWEDVTPDDDTAAEPDSLGKCAQKKLDDVLNTYASDSSKDAFSEWQADPASMMDTDTKYVKNPSTVSVAQAAPSPAMSLVQRLADNAGIESISSDDFELHFICVAYTQCIDICAHDRMELTVCTKSAAASCACRECLCTCLHKCNACFANAIQAYQENSPMLMHSMHGLDWLVSMSKPTPTLTVLQSIVRVLRLPQVDTQFVAAVVRTLHSRNELRPLASVFGVASTLKDVLSAVEPRLLLNDTDNTTITQAMKTAIHTWNSATFAELKVALTQTCPVTVLDFQRFNASGASWLANGTPNLYTPPLDPPNYTYVYEHMTVLTMKTPLSACFFCTTKDPDLFVDHQNCAICSACKTHEVGAGCNTWLRQHCKGLKLKTNAGPKNTDGVAYDSSTSCSDCLAVSQRSAPLAADVADPTREQLDATRSDVFIKHAFTNFFVPFYDRNFCCEQTRSKEMEDLTYTARVFPHRQSNYYPDYQPEDQIVQITRFTKKGAVYGYSDKRAQLHTMCAALLPHNPPSTDATEVFKVNSIVYWNSRMARAIYLLAQLAWTPAQPPSNFAAVCSELLVVATELHSYTRSKTVITTLAQTNINTAYICVVAEHLLGYTFILKNAERVLRTSPQLSSTYTTSGYVVVLYDPDTPPQAKAELAALHTTVSGMRLQTGSMHYTAEQNALINDLFHENSDLNIHFMSIRMLTDVLDAHSTRFQLPLYDGLGDLGEILTVYINDTASDTGIDYHTHIIDDIKPEAGLQLTRGTIRPVKTTHTYYFSPAAFKALTQQQFFKPKYYLSLFDKEQTWLHYRPDDSMSTTMFHNHTQQHIQPIVVLIKTLTASYTQYTKADTTTTARAKPRNSSIVYANVCHTFIKAQLDVIKDIVTQLKAYESICQTLAAPLAPYRPDDPPGSNQTNIDIYCNVVAIYSRLFKNQIILEDNGDAEDIAATSKRQADTEVILPQQLVILYVTDVVSVATNFFQLLESMPADDVAYGPIAAVSPKISRLLSDILEQQTDLLSSTTAVYECKNSLKSMCFGSTVVVQDDSDGSDDEDETPMQVVDATTATPASADAPVVTAKRKLTETPAASPAAKKRFVKFQQPFQPLSLLAQSAASLGKRAAADQVAAAAGEPLPRRKFTKHVPTDGKVDGRVGVNGPFSPPAQRKAAAFTRTQFQEALLTATSGLLPQSLTPETLLREAYTHLCEQQSMYNSVSDTDREATIATLLSETDVLVLYSNTGAAYQHDIQTYPCWVTSRVFVEDLAQKFVRAHPSQVSLSQQQTLENALFKETSSFLLTSLIEDNSHAAPLSALKSPELFVQQYPALLALAQKKHARCVEQCREWEQTYIDGVCRANALVMLAHTFGEATRMRDVITNSRTDIPLHAFYTIPPFDTVTMKTFHQLCRGKASHTTADESTTTTSILDGILQRHRAKIAKAINSSTDVFYEAAVRLLKDPSIGYGHLISADTGTINTNSVRFSSTKISRPTFDQNGLDDVFYIVEKLKALYPDRDKSDTVLRAAVKLWMCWSSGFATTESEHNEVVEFILAQYAMPTRAPVVAAQPSPAEILQQAKDHVRLLTHAIQDYNCKLCLAKRLEYEQCGDSEQQLRAIPASSVEIARLLSLRGRTYDDVYAVANNTRVEVARYVKREVLPGLTAVPPTCRLSVVELGSLQKLLDRPLPTRKTLLQDQAAEQAMHDVVFDTGPSHTEDVVMADCGLSKLPNGTVVFTPHRPAPDAPSQRRTDTMHTTTHDTFESKREGIRVWRSRYIQLATEQAALSHRKAGDSSVHGYDLRIASNIYDPNKLSDMDQRFVADLSQDMATSHQYVQSNTAIVQLLENWKAERFDDDVTADEQAVLRSLAGKQWLGWILTTYQSDLTLRKSKDVYRLFTNMNSLQTKTTTRTSRVMAKLFATHNKSKAAFDAADLTRSLQNPYTAHSVEFNATTGCLEAQPLNPQLAADDACVTRALAEATAVLSTDYKKAHQAFTETKAKMLAEVRHGIDALKLVQAAGPHGDGSTPYSTAAIKTISAPSEDTRNLLQTWGEVDIVEIEKLYDIDIHTIRRMPSMRTVSAKIIQEIADFEVLQLPIMESTIRTLSRTTHHNKEYAINTVKAASAFLERIRDGDLHGIITPTQQAAYDDRLDRAWAPLKEELTHEAIVQQMCEERDPPSPTLAKPAPPAAGAGAGYDRKTIAYFMEYQAQLDKAAHLAAAETEASKEQAARTALAIATATAYNDTIRRCTILKDTVAALEPLQYLHQAPHNVETGLVAMQADLPCGPQSAAPLAVFKKRPQQRIRTQNLGPVTKRATQQATKPATQQAADAEPAAMQQAADAEPAAMDTTPTPPPVTRLSRKRDPPPEGPAPKSTRGSRPGHYGR